MKIKYKVIDLDFDENEKISKATIQTPRGHFMGYFRLQEGDFLSVFTGYSLATIKAINKYIKSEIRETKAIISALRVLYRELEDMKNFNENSIEAKHIKRRIAELQKKQFSLEEYKDNLIQKLFKGIECHLS